MPADDQVPARFGRLVREARHAAGLSQDELGYRAGVTRNYVGEIERGERCPSLVVVIRLVEALDLRLSKFLAPLDREPN